MNTNPSHVPTLTSGRWKRSAVTCGRSQWAGTSCRLPSRCQAKPWNGQRISEQLPSYCLSWRPRWRQALGNALMVSAADRMITYERPAMS